jgi:integrase
MGVKIREHPKGSRVWWVYVDHHGQRRAKKIGEKKLAQEIASKIQARLVLGDAGFLKKDQENEIPTFKQYVYGWESNPADLGWFEKVAKLSLKNSTVTGYKRILETQLIPTFGSTHLNEITSRAIGDFIYAKITGGLRSGTVKNIKNCLSAILQHALTPDGYINVNPARGVIVPHPESEVPSREPNPFTWEEREHLENIFLKHFPRYYPLILCGFRSGCRIGELIGLQIGDLDFYNGLLIVQRNVTRGKVTTPKTESSKRSVRMTNQLMQVLKKHRQTAKEEKIKKSWDAVPEWIFYNEAGAFINYYDWIYRVWNRAMELSGLARRTPHDMRHTYATLRLSKGDSLAEVSKEMGHGSTNITYKTYYKFLPNESSSDINELDGVWKTGRNNPQPRRNQK